MGRKKTPPSKHLIDLRKPKKVQSKFTGKAYEVDGMQSRYIKPSKVSFFKNIRYHLFKKNREFPEDWAEVGVEDE